MTVKSWVADAPAVQAGESKCVCVGTGNSVTGKCVGRMFPPPFVVVVEAAARLTRPNNTLEIMLKMYWSAVDNMRIYS